MAQIDTETAMQRLYEDPSLTEELTDDDAKIVLDWAQEQVKQLAAKFTDEAAFDDAMKSLLRVVKNANRVVGQREFADPSEQEERIDKMTEAAMGMGVVTATAQAADVRDQLNALSSADALKTLLTMFTPASTQTAAESVAEITPASAQTVVEGTAEITPGSAQTVVEGAAEITPASTQTAAESVAEITPAGSPVASAQTAADAPAQSAPPSTPVEDAKSAFSSLFDRLTNRNGGEEDSTP